MKCRMGQFWHASWAWHRKPFFIESTRCRALITKVPLENPAILASPHRDSWIIAAAPHGRDSSTCVDAHVEVTAAWGAATFKARHPRFCNYSHVPDRTEHQKEIEFKVGETLHVRQILAMQSSSLQSDCCNRAISCTPSSGQATCTSSHVSSPSKMNLISSVLTVS